jgi:hypothetical protein
MQHLQVPNGRLRARLLLAVEIFLVALAGFGIIYWAFHGSLIGVALSALLPGPGVVWMLANSRSVNSPKGD